MIDVIISLKSATSDEYGNGIGIIDSFLWRNFFGFCFHVRFVKRGN